MRSRRMTLAAAVAALALGLVPIAPRVVGATSGAMPSDFDGDGYADLAIGVPGESGPSLWWEGGRAAGAVNVLYGSSSGLTAAGDQYWTQDSPGVKGKSLGSTQEDDEFEADEFGATLASGDFDRDGYADLAVGVPWDWIGVGTGGLDQGAVNVLYGSPTGLTAAGDQYWTGSSLFGPGIDPWGTGEAIAAGDFDQDGYWDLAIAARRYRHQPEGNDSLAVILYGGPIGLTAVGATVLTRAATNFLDGTSAMVAGDLDGDGFADLALGHRYANVGAVEYAGAVDIYHGSADGLTTVGSQVLTQDSDGVEDDAEAGDMFGGSLAVGDFDADGFGDLAVGAPHESLARPRTGAVGVLFGSPTGPSTDGGQLWHQDSPGLPGVSDVDDWFGSSVASGDFDGDGADDLVIGVPGETRNTPGGVQGRGAVTTLYGGSTGLSPTGSQLWHQDIAGVPGRSEQYDVFGSSLRTGNFGRSGRDDLAIGVPGEALGRLTDAGMVNVLYGRATGLSVTYSQGWSQSTTGVKGSAESGDAFGAALGTDGVLLRP